jgi:hypothetical protein
MQLALLEQKSDSLERNVSPQLAGFGKSRSVDINNTTA